MRDNLLGLCPRHSLPELRWKLAVTLDPSSTARLSDGQYSELWMHHMSENVLNPLHGILNSNKETTWKSCQMYGGSDKYSQLGAFFCNLNCEHLSTDDQLFLCQIGVDDGSPTVNSLEILREGRWLVLNTYVQAAGGYQDIVCYRASGNNIKISVKPEVNAYGEYDCVRFMIFDADKPNFNEAVYVRTYSLPSTQEIDRVAVILCPFGDYDDDYCLNGIPVGVNNFCAYGIGNMPEKLEPNFEWFGEEFNHKNERIISRHYERYNLSYLANLRQWKKRV